MAVIFAALAMVMVLVAAYGIRLIRADVATDLLPVEEGHATEDRVPGPFVRLIDFLGMRFQRTLRRIYGPMRIKALDARLKNAGNPEGLFLDLFMQREAGFVVLAGCIGFFFALTGRWLLGLLLAVVFGGWMHLWLIAAARKRRAEIDRDLPDFLDVLAVTVRSGLPFRSALERVSVNFEGAIAEEMMRALHEMRLGASRRDAFVALRERCGSQNISTFVGALLQSEELGTPIADALVSITSEIRKERAQEVRRAAARAQPKVTLVATVTMLPGAMILMAGGIIFSNREVLAGMFGG
ncbi:MAG: type II secretion system F family protein [Actinomyces sp.]|uniref:type II secretion system F family protein n=1 Tax=Actinomyces sp. TaxID=29317 RepID=UPI0026DB65B2|nr:type II secretion system F family protein [Actinomyces sp.]MDO4242966.1 type II secretion system F family protein [Actinomyces sp.]